MTRDEAVSAVVSELLLIVLVLILIPSVTITLMNQLPEDRVPTVHIKMGPVDNNTVNLSHKGGDYLVQKDLIIFVNGEGKTPVFYSSSATTFDLGDYFSVSPVNKGDSVRVVAKNTVVFSGVIT